MAQGKVKSFDKERGYGFSGVGDTAPRTLEQGERVAYQPKQDRRGFTAKNVCILKEATALPADRLEAARVGASTHDKDYSLSF